MPGTFSAKKNLGRTSETKRKKSTNDYIPDIVFISSSYGTEALTWRSAYNPSYTLAIELQALPQLGTGGESANVGVQMYCVWEVVLVGVIGLGINVDGTANHKTCTGGS